MVSREIGSLAVSVIGRIRRRRLPTAKEVADFTRIKAQRPYLRDLMKTTTSLLAAALLACGETMALAADHPGPISGTIVAQAKTADGDSVVQLTRVRDLDIVGPNGKRGFISAASGLVRAGNYLHVVSDDELQLASFLVGSDQPGRLFNLLDGVLPETPAARKKEKPDFEILLALPPNAASPHGALLALGSGSRPNRRRGVVVALGADGNALASHVADLTPLFTPLDALLKETNLEGAAIRGNEFLLFQRGNAGAAVNAIVAYPLDTMLKFLSDPTVVLPQPHIRKVDLGVSKGVPLGFNDAAVLPDGRIVFVAAAEASSTAYDDGALSGAVVGLMDRTGAVLSERSWSPLVKVEGITARLEGDSIHLYAVTDADNPEIATGLYEAVLDLK